GGEIQGLSDDIVQRVRRVRVRRRRQQAGQEVARTVQGLNVRDVLRIDPRPGALVPVVHDRRGVGRVVVQTEGVAAFVENEREEINLATAIDPERVVAVQNNVAGPGSVSPAEGTCQRYRAHGQRLGADSDVAKTWIALGSPGRTERLTTVV